MRHLLIPSLSESRWHLVKGKVVIGFPHAVFYRGDLRRTSVQLFLSCKQRTNWIPQPGKQTGSGWISVVVNHVQGKQRQTMQKWQCTVGNVEDFNIGKDMKKK